MPKWISILERMPDNKTLHEVLVTDGQNCYVAVEWWSGETPADTDWSYSNCCGCKASGITHWMELPNSPKEQQRKQNEQDYLNALNNK